MLCQFERLVYPASARAVNAGSYMVAVYRPCEKVVDSAGNAVRQVKAVGYCLPISQHLRYDMQGKWTRDARHGVQFEMDTYSEVIFPTREAITAYLCSGQIKGIGPKLAERIYAAFGNSTLEVLDKEPEKLLEITGISTGKLKKICESYLANRGARDVVAFLSPHGITANRAVKLYREYGKRTLQIVREHPYQLCDMDGIGFLTADRIAESMGFDKLSTERVDEGLIFTLKDAEGKGHLCMEKKAFIRACLKLLDTPALTEDMAANRAMRLLHEGRIVTYNGFVYRDRTAQAEQHLANLRGALELPHDAVEPEAAPRGGQGNGEELGGGVVQGRWREGGERGSNGVVTALILPIRQGENKRIVAVFRQNFVRKREWQTIWAMSGFNPGGARAWRGRWREDGGKIEAEGITYPYLIATRP